MEIIISLFVFIFVIGVMVLVHEWGHFIAAKKIGVAVEAFSIGFGPKLFGWKRGETEYKISILPFGGYVKMLAENPDEGVTGDPREFQSRKRWERFIILFMGPMLNIVLAYLLWVGIIMVGEPKEEWLTKPPQVEYVTPGSPADKVGIQRGDIVESVNGMPMKTWEQLVYEVATNPREELTVTVDRAGKKFDFVATPFEDPVSGIGSIGVSPGYPAVIDGVAKDMPADIAGLKNGDVVLAINGRPVGNYYDMFDEISRRTRAAYAMRTLAVTDPVIASFNFLESSTFAVDMRIQRAGKTFDVTLSPVFDTAVGSLRIGISRPSMPEVMVSQGPLEAFVGAGQRCVDMTARLYDVLVKMITGKLSSKALSGPVEIAAISGKTAEQGLLPLLSLMAFISLNLGIVNLLPLPVLDGGQITILLIEGIARRDMSAKVKDWIMRVGVVLLLLLMVLVISQDISKLISRMG